VLEAIGTAVTRTTTSGQVLGPQERVSAYTALLGVTRNAAYIYREEAVKGTITAGKTADLVVLDGNPLTVAPEKIKHIAVVETIKRGISL
jgi:predicted amidohydrolase YtcJ